MLTKMLCKPRPPSICIEIGKRGRRPFYITGFATQQPTPPPSLCRFVLEGGRGVGIVSPASAGKYIKKEIKLVLLVEMMSVAPLSPLQTHAQQAAPPHLR